jgi:hypothetical protein
MPILLILRNIRSLVTLTVLSVTVDKFKPLIIFFSESYFALSYAAIMFILMIL